MDGEKTNQTNPALTDEETDAANTDTGLDLDPSDQPTIGEIGGERKERPSMCDVEAAVFKSTLHYERADRVKAAAEAQRKIEARFNLPERTGQKVFAMLHRMVGANAGEARGKAGRKLLAMLRRIDTDMRWNEAQAAGRCWL